MTKKLCETDSKLTSCKYFENFQFMMLGKKAINTLDLKVNLVKNKRIYKVLLDLTDN